MVELCAYFVSVIMSFTFLKVTNEARDFILQLNKGTDMHSSMAVAHVFSPVSIT